MKSALYLKTSEDGIYHLLYSNELKLSHFKVICFYAELFGFISQALALIRLLSAKLRSFAEIEVKSCLNLLLGELLKFPHCGADFQISLFFFFCFFFKPFPVFPCKRILPSLCIRIMTVCLTSCPIYPCLTKVTLKQQPAG